MRKDWFVLILCFVCCVGASGAQGAEAVRSRAGMVADAETGDPLLGAAILVKGTTQGTTTDFDGMFRIPVQSGDTLSISYVGYKSQLVVMGSANADTLYIYLSADTEVLDEVAVVAKRRTNSDMAVLQATKQALTIQEGISSEQIKRSQDKDAAEVIRRVPGISLIDDKFVMVRGLSQRYNQVWLNGAAVPSSEADSRAFSFDLLPSSQLDNMVIVKSPTPEYPADFSGGMVLITT
ncbi:MAG: carboxypeptidase-like regulatory domain-containing protein, partial [Paludibacteraceae bacterium]